MTRRITAVLLMVAILLSVIPGVVSAEEDYIYQIGDDIWIKADDTDVVPTAPIVENGRWVKVIGENGQHETKPSCDKEIHEKHVPSCYHSVYGLICTKEIHTLKSHSIYCTKLTPKYHWVVEVDPDYVPPETPPAGGEGEGGDLEADDSGFYDDEGLIYFTVTNLDSEEKPISGSKFGLFAWDGESYAYLENQSAKAEVQQKIEQQNLEQQEKILELQESGDQKALEEYLQQANQQNEQAIAELEEASKPLLAKTTNKEGKVYFRSLENYLSEDPEEGEGGKDTWQFRLVQADVNENYKQNQQAVEVKIEKTGDAAYQLYLDDQLYSAEKDKSGGIIFENQIEEFKLLVYVQFFDQDGKKIAGEALNDVTASIDVVRKNENAEEEGQTLPVNFPPEDVIVEAQKWKQTLKVSPGTYQAGEPLIQGKIDGYSFVSCERCFELPQGTIGQGPKVDEVTLGKLTGASLSIKAYYQKDTEPPQTDSEKPVKYTVIVESVDDSDEPVTGAKYSLDDVAGITKEEKGNQWIYTIDTETCVPGNYILEETLAPEGYQKCKDSYTIAVEENGDVILSEGGILRRLFTRSNLAESGGTETVVFRHTKIKETESTTDPTTEQPVVYTIIVESVEKGSGKAVAGARYSLEDVAGIQKSEKGHRLTFTIDTGALTQREYVLQETAAPQGYHLCTDQYTIAVDDHNDLTLYKDGNPLQRLLAGKSLAESGGKATVTFQHAPKTAKVSIQSMVTAMADRLCWNRDDTIAEFSKKEHIFLLKWKNAKGEWKQEELSVGSETKTFKQALPYGTEYEVVPKDASLYSYQLTGNKKGTVSAADTTNGIMLTADIFYNIIHGDDLDLYFTKVDSRTGESLIGAKFTLTDSNGQELQRYTTKKGGAVDVEDIIDRPGKYLLKETKAPEEYDVLRKPIEINVTVDYRPATRRGETVVEQYLRLEEKNGVVHKSVIPEWKTEDGTYWIKNTASGDNPKTGDRFDLGLWIGILVVSMAGLVVTAQEIRKKKCTRK